MRPRHFSFTPEAAATNSLALSQALGGAGSVSLSGTYGANGFTSGLGWNITLTSSANISAVNFTFTYLDAQGNQQTATTTGPNATTKNVGIYAYKLLSVTTDAAASNVLIGHTNLGYSKWIGVPFRSNTGESGVFVGIAGTANCQLRVTFANIADNSIFTGTFDDIDHISMTGFTVSTYGKLEPRTAGCRLKINSWSSGDIRMDITPPAMG